MGFIMLMTGTCEISQGTWSCCQILVMARQYLADQPSGQIWEASDFPDIAYKTVNAAEQDKIL